MATRDAVEITRTASCTEHGTCGCIEHELGYCPDAGLVTIAESDAKSNLSPPSTPSTGSTRSKRSLLWSDDDEWSTESEPDQKRVKKRSVSAISASSSRHSLNSLNHPCLPRDSDNFLDFCDQPGIAFVDKTECILHLPDRFQFLLLRPPRFGKTTFLSTLYHYYDIHGATAFSERFGSLAVVTEASDPIPLRNQHLCLSFDLSDVRVESDITEITSQLNDQISFILTSFLIKYAAELHLSHPDNFLDDEHGCMFAKVFDLVKSRGYSLFVGVDNCDAPSRSRSFAHIDFPASHQSFATPPQIEDLLDSCFWGPLLAESHVIAKLFVMGTMFVKYSALGNLDLGAIPPSLQSCCGFTEEQTLKFAHSILDETPNMADLRLSCGNYIFSSANSDNGMAEPVLHPRRLIAQIFELYLQHPHTDEYSFHLLSGILNLVPEESDVAKAVTIDGLIELLATGAVEIGGEIDSAGGFDTVTWSTLYHAGALTYDRESAGTLRVASSAVLSLIHSRLDTLFAGRHDLDWLFLDTWYQYNIHNNRRPFLDLMSQVLRDQTQRSLGHKREANLRGIFELVMRNSRCSPSECPGPLILPPTDAPCVEIPAAYVADKVHVWELKTLTLLGMWQATNRNDDEPTVEALQTLHEELVRLDDEALLAQPYRVWSPTLDAMETVLVGNFLDPEPENPQFLAVGGARILMRQRPEEEEEQFQ